MPANPFVSRSPSNRDEFEVAILCALGKEHDAVRFVCDRLWTDEGKEYGKSPGDRNEYTTGLIGKHNVVLVQLPHMGKEAAATAAAHLQMSYRNVRLALLVGVCGGTPIDDESKDILLGDVIISNEIIQYDFGRLYSDGFQTRDTSKNLKNDPHIYSFVERLRDGHSRRRLEEHWEQHMENIRGKDTIGLYKYPGSDTDNLFQSNYRHMHHQTQQQACECCTCTSRWDPVCLEARNKSCAELGCDQAFQIHRDLTGRKIQKRSTSVGDVRDERLPSLHFGVMGCGDMVIKCAENRDQIAERVGAIAFEMESAGIFHTFAGIVIKGVCDYADSHKNKNWQFYAAGTAAAATKAVLEQFTPEDRPALMEVIQSTPSSRPNLHDNPNRGQIRYHVRHKVWHKFVGRKRCLDSMEHGLFGETGDSKQRCFVVHGMGGSGKTQVTLQFAELHRERFSGVFLVDASNPTTIERDFAAIGEKVGRSATYDDAIDYLATSQGDWLLILDDVDEGKTPIRRYFPPTTRGCIIITTRKNHLIYHATVGDYKLGEMDPHEGITLFLTEALKDPENQQHRLVAADIAEELGYLPLALAHAAVPIRHKLCRLSDYKEYFATNKQRLMKDPLMQYENDTYKHSVYTCFMGSIDTIRVVQNGSVVHRALEILQICAYFHFRDIPEELFDVAPSRRDNTLAVKLLDYILSFSPVRRLERWLSGPSPTERTMVEDRQRIVQALGSIPSPSETPKAENSNISSHENRKALALLDSNSLGHYDPDTRLFSVHPLFHEWNKIQLIYREAQWARWSAGTALANFAGRDRFKGSRQRLLSHIDFYLQSDNGDEPKSASLAVDQSRVAANFALVYQDSGIYTTANIISEESLRGLQDSLGAQHPETLRSLNNMAVLLDKKREHAKAAELSRQAWEGRKLIVGERHNDTLESLSIYALSLYRLGHFSEAERLHRQCLETREQTLGPDTAGTIDSVINLALALLRQSNHEEGIELLNRALRWREQNLGAEHRDTIQTTVELATALRDAGKTEMAARVGRGSLEKLRRVLGNTHPDTLVGMTNLATILQKLGHVAEAERLSTDAIAGMTQHMGSTNLNTLLSMESLASIYSLQGRVEEAEKLYRTVLSGYETHFDENHADILSIMISFGRVLRLGGKCDEAEALYQRALAGFLAKHHPEHIDVIKCKLNFATLLGHRGRHKEAEILYNDVDSCLKASHPRNDYLNAECSYCLSICLRNLGRLSDAVEKAKQAANYFTKVHGAESLAVMDSLASLAYLFSLQKKHAEAWSVFQEALHGYSALGGPPTVGSTICGERFEEMCKEMKKMGIPQPQEAARRSK
ncbi:hypothetical protein F4776DRAFT_603310 [Hypoxylon sp. NC0597]|nr:hypothetical protein F4776DRAFT_603310 [Hypoxylon sp. NC0597]